MSGPKQLVNRPELEVRRQEVQAILQNSFALSLLDDEAFERRLEGCINAQSEEELLALVQDLKPRTSVAMVPSAGAALAPARSETAMSIVSKQEHVLEGELTSRQRFVSVMGELTADLRGVTFNDSCAEVELLSILGTITVIVPPGVRVDAKGPVILGELKQKLSPLTNTAFRLRLRSKVILGEIVVVECQPNESIRQAKRRHALERKAVERAKKRALKAGGGV